MSDLYSYLQKNLGSKGWVKPEDAEPWERDWLNLHGEKSIAIARPKTTDEVSRVLRFCYEKSIPVVPQGGKTGLVGLLRANRINCITF